LVFGLSCVLALGAFLSASYGPDIILAFKYSEFLVGYLLSLFLQLFLGGLGAPFCLGFSPLFFWGGGVGLLYPDAPICDDKRGP